MSSERRKTSGTDRPAASVQRGREYRRPELVEYGSLRQLTRSGAFDIPGDSFNTSFAN